MVSSPQRVAWRQPPVRSLLVVVLLLSLGLVAATSPPPQKLT
jgi:hypothetical protein